MKGEFYSTIHDIVSQQEAWDMIIFGEDFQAELFSKHGEEYTHEELVGMRDAWKRQGISHYEGFFLRSDGMVELEEV